ncbi:hypothetical protein WDA79_02500 [Streptomyces sp. A475]|uniref:hypothetical protein n=1 Tax=Streptomyces sp. A475 TaxID=3131976 RepID=UPI0030C8EB64
MGDQADGVGLGRGLSQSGNRTGYTAVYQRLGTFFPGPSALPFPVVPAKPTTTGTLAAQVAHLPPRVGRPTRVRPDPRAAARTPAGVPPVRGEQGRPRRPEVVLGDRGYDHDKYRRLVCDPGVKPLIAAAEASTGPASAGNAGLWCAC